MPTGISNMPLEVPTPERCTNPPVTGVSEPNVACERSIGPFTTPMSVTAWYALMPGTTNVVAASGTASTGGGASTGWLDPPPHAEMATNHATRLIGQAYTASSAGRVAESVLCQLGHG